jgi:hypothetical protein
MGSALTPAVANPRQARPDRWRIGTGRRTALTGTSIAPALDTAAAVIILALPLHWEAVFAPKSFNRIPAVPATATDAATSMGTFLWANT